MKSLFLLFFGAVFLENFVLIRFHGSTHALAASRSLRTALGMGLTTAVIMTLCGPLSYLLSRYLLLPLGLWRIRLLFLLLLIALVTHVWMLLLEKHFPALSREAGIYLPLTAVNCAITALCLSLSEKAFTGLVPAVVHSLGAGLGFLLATLVLWSVMARLQERAVPAAFRGVPLALISAGLCALAFSGFAVIG